MFSTLVSAFASAIFLFIWGWFFAMVVFRKSQERHFAQVSRPSSEINVGMIAVEKVVQGALLTLIYQRFVPSSEIGFVNGLIFGALVGGLLEATYFFTFWINLRVPLVPMITRSIAGWIRMILAGGIIGWLTSVSYG